MISLENRRAVIVEDDEWFAEQLATIMKKQGMNCQTASFADEALAKIDTHLPDVILLDMLLTGSTGLVLLHELQSHDDLARIPVIICSATADMLEQPMLAAYGVRRVIDKTTMHPDDVLVAVRSVLA